MNRRARIELACGQRALRIHRADLQSLEAIAQEFSVRLHEAPLRVERQIEETKQLRKILQERNKHLANLLARGLYEKARQMEEFRFEREVFENEEMEFLKLVAQSLLAKGPCLALLASRGMQVHLVFAQSDWLPWDLRPIMAECCKLIDGKGGGTSAFTQGGGKNTSQLQAALDLVEARIVSK